MRFLPAFAAFLVFTGCCIGGLTVDSSPTGATVVDPASGTVLGITPWKVDQDIETLASGVCLESQGMWPVCVSQAELLEQKGTLTLKLGAVPVVDMTSTPPGVALEFHAPSGEVVALGTTPVSWAPPADLSSPDAVLVLVARLDGYATYTQRVSPRDLASLGALVFEMVPACGLEIEGKPRRANVVLTGPEGYSSEGTVPLEFGDLAPGTYEIAASKSGYHDHQQTVTLVPGETISVKLALEQDIPDPQEFVGTWINDDRNTGGLKRLILGWDGSYMRVHGFGACGGGECDWEEIKARYDGNPFKAVYRRDWKTNTMRIELIDENSLKVKTDSVYTDRRPRQKHTYRMHREGT